MKNQKIHYRAHDWVDIKQNKVVFGIQAKLVGWEVRWRHCAEDDKPLFFEKEGDRDNKLKELKELRKIERAEKKNN